jgi:hypothetical protein
MITPRRSKTTTDPSACSVTADRTLSSARAGTAVAIAAPGFPGRGAAKATSQRRPSRCSGPTVNRPLETACRVSEASDAKTFAAPREPQAMRPSPSTTAKLANRGDAATSRSNSAEHACADPEPTSEFSAAALSSLRALC